MIKTEIETINGVEYAHTYSDEGYYIEREGVKYSDAVDPVESGRVYTETTEKIETEVDDIKSEVDEEVDDNGN